ncbi:hypothetical protein Fmac_027581 [Flemingia macrophylla]|uniref:Transcription factor TFIIB cyclin-like domain-containing protein n=1 Tax=Flemingia macrophylla TaxID=520843 RepID=A0ABD1LI36_9FABA
MSTRSRGRKRRTEVVFDHSGGDTVCSECGLSGDNDPVRVGGPTNPLLTDSGLSTVIAKPNGGSGEFLSSSLGRWQNRGSNPNRALILAFKTITTMSNRYLRSLRLAIEELADVVDLFSGWDSLRPSRIEVGISNGKLTEIVLMIAEKLKSHAKDRANEIYKRVEDQKSSRGRNQDALLAACLYIACRQEDKPRTVKGTLDAS